MGKKYNKNYLSKVLLKFNFYENLTLSNLKEYSNKIESYLPQKEQHEGLSGEINLNMMSGDVRQESHKTTTWIYYSQDRKKKIEVAPNYILLEYSNNSYSDSSQLFTDTGSLILPFFDTYNLKNAKRIGLRYTNEIQLSDKNNLDWKKYINPNLIGAPNFVLEQKKKLARAMSQVIIKEDNADLLFNYGIWNKDYPNEVLKKEFILDYDCFSNLGVEKSDILSRTREYHSLIEGLFEASITEDFRKLLNK